VNRAQQETEHKKCFELSFSVADSLKVLLGNLAAGKKADGGRF